MEADATTAVLGRVDELLLATTDGTVVGVVFCAVTVTVLVFVEDVTDIGC